MIKAFTVNHRKIVELHLGRRLTRYEVVHHVNGDRADNRIENLRVMSQSEHASLHHRERALASGGLVAMPVRIPSALMRKIRRIAKKERRSIMYMARELVEQGLIRRAELEQSR